MKRGPYRKASLLDRLERRTARAGECWLWMGRTMPEGYGQITSGGKTLLTHRVAYEQLVGPVPEGMNVLHRCDRPGCWNPAHLFTGTHADNVADKVAKGRQHKGYQQPMLKLIPENVPVADRLHESGYSWQRLARLFNVSHDVVRVRCLKARACQF